MKEQRKSDILSILASEVQSSKIYIEAAINSLSDTDKNTQRILLYAVNITATFYEKSFIVKSFAQVYKSDKGDIKKIAAAAELLMISALVFDDIIDKTEKRNKKATVWKKFGINNAVLAGDILSSLSYDLVASIKKETPHLKKIIKLYCNTRLDLLKGQAKIEQYNAGLSHKMMPAAISAAQLRCGSLFKFCFIALSLLTDDLIHEKKIGSAGYKTGTAMQIRDDILDYIAVGNKINKPGMEDFINGQPNIVTAFLIGAVRNKQDLMFIKKKWALTMSSADKLRLKKLAEKTGALNYSIEYLNLLCEQAKMELNFLPQGSTKKIILDFIDLLKIK